jgi:hypothetical protein
MKNWEPFLRRISKPVPHRGIARDLRVFACVGHAEKTLASVLELEVLIGELLAVDGLAASSITLGEVTTLDHELLDDTVEGRALIAVALLASS